MPLDKAQQDQAEIARLRTELENVRFAARMPDDYQYGLPAWINHIWTSWQSLLDRDGLPIRRTEDIEEMRKLRVRLAALQKSVITADEALQLAEARALLSAVVKEHQLPGAHGEDPYPYRESPETRAFAACDICQGAMEWLAEFDATRPREVQDGGDQLLESPAGAP